MDVTDLAWVILAGGAVCDTGRAAVKVFEDDFLTLDDQLTDTACTVPIFSKDKSSHTETIFSVLHFCFEGCLTNKPGLNASSFGEDRVVRVTTHVQILIQIQPLELALRRGNEHLLCESGN